MESGSAINLSTCLPQVTPAKFLRTAFRIRGLSSAYISRVFLRTEMALKSRNVLTGSRSLARSRSTDNLPTSQSQVNIQMMSHTLTIREVCTLSSSFSPHFDSIHIYVLFAGNKNHYYVSLSMRPNFSTRWHRRLLNELAVKTGDKATLPVKNHH